MCRSVKAVIRIACVCIVFAAFPNAAFAQSNPCVPRVVSFFGGEAADVVIQGDYAYLANRLGGLVILDLSDPAQPVRLANLRTGRDATSVDVEGNIVVLGEEDDGVSTIDVSDPAAPVLLDSFDTKRARDVLIFAKLLFVADDDTGVDLLNIADPANITLLSSVNTTNDAGSLARRGSFLFVAGGRDGLAVLDFTDPLTPTQIATYEPFSITADVAIDGATLYLTLVNGFTRAFNISTPTQPVELGAFFTSGSGIINTLTKDGFLFVANQTVGLRIYNVANPATPINAASLPEVRGRIALGPDTLFSADGGVLWAYDPGLDPNSGAASPTQLGRYIQPAARGVAARNGYAFVPGAVVDLADIANPVAINTLGETFRDTSAMITLRDNTAYVADLHKLTVLDIADPTMPSILASIDIPFGGVDDVAAADGLLIVSKLQTELLFFDVADPADPVLLNAFPFSGARGVLIDGDVAYASNLADGVEFLDISDPANPLAFQSVFSTASTVDVALRGDKLYTANNCCAGVLAFDVSDPQSPSFFDSFEPDQGSQRIAAGDRRFFVIEGLGNGTSFVRVYDIQGDGTLRDPTAITVDGWLREVHAQQRFAHATAQRAGMLTIDTEPCGPCPGDTNGDNVVDGADLVAVLANFGQVVTGGPVDGDFDDSGTVDGSDLVALLAAFGSSC